MDDPRGLLRRAGAMAAGVIAQVKPDQLDDPTPCTEWNVRDVINHMAGGNLRIAALVTGGPGPDRGDNVLGDDPLAAFRDSFERLCAAFDTEGFLNKTFPTPFGEGSGRMLVTLRVGELTVHTWDLAAATGRPRDLEPDLVAASDSLFRARPVPRSAQGPIGPEQPVPTGATAADRLAAFAGRTIPQPPQ